MRILFWNEGFWPRIGGIETQTLALIQSLMRRGHSCTVIAQQDHPKWPKEETYFGVPIRRFDFDSIIGRKQLYHLKDVESYVEKLWVEFRPDIVHLNTWMGWSTFAFSLFRKMLPIPVVLTLHTPHDHDANPPPFADRIFPIVDQICCVSQWVLNQVEQRIPSTKGKLKLIYNGLALPQIAPRPLCFSPPTLLLLGRLSQEKGFDIAIKALSQLKIQTLIVGEGKERANLEKLVHEYHLDNYVQFTGAISIKEIPSWINRATLFCMPSTFEPFGLAALEAMQMQRPVIASRVGGLPEIILENKTGLLIPENDPQALSNAIQSLLANPTKAIQMGLSGRSRATEHFTLEQNVTAYENLYKTL